MEILKEYLLIKFVPTTIKEKRKIAIDCTRSAWVFLCPQRLCLVTKFLGPPYNKENNDLLDSLLKSKADAPEDWPTYPIEVKGQADSYEEAMLKLEVLQVKEFVFTTDSEMEPQKKATLLERSLKTRQLNISGNTKTAMTSVPRMGSDSEEVLQHDSSGDGTSDSSVACQTNKNKRKQQSHKSDDKSQKPKQLKSVVKYLSPLKKKNTEPKQSTSSSAKIPKPGPSSADKKKSAHDRTISLAHGTSKDRGIVIDKNHDAGIDRRKDRLNNTKPHSQLGTNNNEEVRVNNKNDDLSLVLSVLQALASDTKEILANQRLILHELGGTGGLQEQFFTDKRKINVPFLTTGEFNEFNNDLKTDDAFRKEFVSSLVYLYDRDLDLSKTVTNILKKYLCRNVIATYTAKKKVQGKGIFRETPFYQSIANAIVQSHQRPGGRLITEDMVSSVVGKVFNNAKDWEGQRQKRASLHQLPETNEGGSSDSSSVDEYSE